MIESLGEGGVQKKMVNVRQDQKNSKKGSLPNRNSYPGYRTIYSFSFFGDEFWNRHGPNVDNSCHPTKLLKYLLKDICFNSYGEWAYHLSNLHSEVFKHVS